MDMRKFIYAVVLVLAMSSVSAVAQDGDRPEKKGKKVDRTEMVKRRTDRMAERYGLDEKQTAKLLELNTEHMGRMQPMGRPSRMRRGGAGDGNDVAPDREAERPSKEQMEEMRKKMSESREKYEAELKKIMTSDQYAKYEQDRQDMKQRRGRNADRKKKD